MNPSQTKALLSLLFGSTCIAFAPILVRLSETGPMSSGFWRMSIAFASMLVFHRWLRLNPRPSTVSSKPVWYKSDWVIFSLLGFFFAGDLATWHVSLQHTAVTNTLLIINANVFVVALAAWVIFNERPTRALVVGACWGVAGVSILILGSTFGASDSGKIFSDQANQPTLFGDMLSVATNLFYAAYLLLMRYALRKHTAAYIMLFSNGICAFFLLLLAFIFHENILPQTAYGWGIVIVLALLCQVFGQTSISRGLEGLPLGFSSMVLLTQPVIGAILSAWILHEPIYTIQWIGGVLVFFGIYWARPSESRTLPKKSF